MTAASIDVQTEATSAQSEVRTGRYVVENDRDVVVFLIGIRFNGVNGIVNAVRTFFRMPAMLEEIMGDPEIGCLSMRYGLTARSATIVQYWRSFEDLERYARSDRFRHRGAWGWYNRLGRTARGAGIWHETFRVSAGAYEGIGANIPPAGIAAAMGSTPVDPPRQSARKRLGLDMQA